MTARGSREGDSYRFAAGSGRAAHRNAVPQHLFADCNDGGLDLDQAPPGALAAAVTAFDLVAPTSRSTDP